MKLALVLMLIPCISIAVPVSYTWEASTGNPEFYSVFRSDNGSDYVFDSITQTNSVTIDAKEGDTLRIRVRAEDSNGNKSVYSDESDPVVVQAPEPPTTTSPITYAVNTVANTVDLSINQDWIHYGLGGTRGINRKAGVISGIGTLQVPNSANGGTTRYTPGLSWTDGTPTASATNTTAGLTAANVGDTFSVVLPAGDIALYVGAYQANASIAISAVDDSITPVTIPLFGTTTHLQEVLISSDPVLEFVEVRYSLDSLTANRGEISLMSIAVRGEVAPTPPPGTDEEFVIILTEGINLVSLPVKDDRINTASDLILLFSGNVLAVIRFDSGKQVVISGPGEYGDTAIKPNETFMLLAKTATSVTIRGLPY